MNILHCFKHWQPSSGPCIAMESQGRVPTTSWHSLLVRDKNGWTAVDVEGLLERTPVATSKTKLRKITSWSLFLLMTYQKADFIHTKRKLPYLCPLDLNTQRKLPYLYPLDLNGKYNLVYLFLHQWEVVYHLCTAAVTSWKRRGWLIFVQ